MRKFLLVLVIVVLYINQTQAQTLTKLSEPVFKSGEQLNYKMKYGIFTAAEAHLRVEDSENKLSGHPAYHIIVDGQTAGTFDIFYKVRNRYESFVDRSTLMPYYYSENRHEASYHHTDKVFFDHNDHKVTADKGVFPFKGQIFDFVSAYYFARNIDLTKVHIGETMKLQYFLEDGVHNLEVTYLGKEQVSCSMGTFNCLKFCPTIIPGRIFRKNSKLYLWVTDDNNRIPVKAHVEVIVGSLTMDLSAARNLKYPLNPVNKNTDD